MTIHTRISADGTLVLQADSQLEAFALVEWQRRRKLGKATLVVEPEVMLERVQGRNDRHDVVKRILRTYGPCKFSVVAKALRESGTTLSDVTVYGYLGDLKRDKQVNNINGEWSIAEVGA